MHPLDVIVDPRRAHCQQQADGIAGRCKLLEQLNCELRERIRLLDDEAETALQMAEREFGKLDEILRTAIQARSSARQCAAHTAGGQARRLTVLDTIDEQLLRKQGLLREQVQPLQLWLLLTACG